MNRADPGDGHAAWDSIVHGCGDIAIGSLALTGFMGDPG